MKDVFLNYLLPLLIALVLIDVVLRINERRKYVQTRSFKVKFADSKWTYTYFGKMGDGIVPPEYTNGLVVGLPKEFPQIYLDSHADGSPYGSAQGINTDQKIDLEGDFNESFQLFAPKDFQNLALSVITPDIMQTFIGSSSRFDIEIFEDQLRLISPESVIFDESRQEELRSAAHAILNELDHKLKTWRPSNEFPTLLKTTEGSTIKVGKSGYVKMSRIIGSACLAATLFIIYTLTRGA